MNRGTFYVWLFVLSSGFMLLMADGNFIASLSGTLVAVAGMFYSIKVLKGTN